MKGLVFTGDKTLELQDYPDPNPDHGEVVLEVMASGMCGTDLHQYRAPRADNLFIAGHEPCGRVAKIGPGVTEKQARIGDRVMVHHYDGCRVCKHCNEGWTQMCDELPMVYGGPNGHGAHAKYIKVAAHTLIKLHEKLSYKAGAAISCGTGTAYGGLKRLDIKGDETIVIFGQGPVGLSGTQLAKAMGARVIAVDVQKDRRELALKFGADHVIDPQNERVPAVVRGLTHGKGAHLSMDCSSNPVARGLCLKVLRKWGRACLVGVNGDMTFSVDQLIFKQLDLVGSWTFSKTQQAECAEFIVERGLEIDELFTHEFELDQAVDAYELFDQQQMGKGVFLFDHAQS